MKRRILACLLTVAILLSMLPVSVLAADTVASGTCGDNLTWTLDSDGVLTISGTGEMDSYDYGGAPWFDYLNGFQKSITSIVIKEGVTNIGSQAFFGCSNLTSIMIPDSITSIDSGVFSYCESLTNITIPDSVTSIGSSVFSCCSSLTNVTIPDSITSIGEHAFYDCSNLTNITIPDSVTSIGSSAFSDCIRLTNITIPDSVTSIGDFAFSDCDRLTNITIPDSVTSIGEYAFGWCERLASIIIPNGVTSISPSTFSGCSSLASITIPDSVTSIGNGAFKNCRSLTSITIPDSVTSIEPWTFGYCISLTDVTIPDSVTSIGNYAFYECSSLTSVTFCGDAPIFSSDVFSNVIAAAYYPAGNATWTSDVMQDYGGTIAWEAYEKAEDPDVPVVIPTLTLKYPTVSFEDEIIMDVFFDVTDLGDLTPDQMGLITFTSEVADGNIDNADAVIPGVTLDAATGFFRGNTQGIAAKNLGDTIYFRAYAQLSDGSYVYSNMEGYSPKTYAYTVLNGNYSTNMKSLVAAMLNYGAVAQVYFGYSTDELLNAGMTDAHKALIDDYSADMVTPVVNADNAKVGDFVGSGGFSKRYPTVSFEGAFSINYFFTPSNAVDGELTLYYWNQAAYNNATTLTTDNATGALVMTGNGEMQADVTGIAAKNLDGTIYVAAVYQSNGSTYCSGVLAYSIGAYCLDRIANGSATMQTFAAATAVYGYYAKVYFTSK